MSRGAGAPLAGMRPARRTVEQGPRLSGMRPCRRAEARGLEPARIGPLPGRTYALRAQALLRRPRANGCSRRHVWAEFKDNFAEAAP
jgi:hypothetical protein